MKSLAKLLIAITVLMMLYVLAYLPTAESNIDLIVMISALCFLGIMLRIWQAMLFQAINHGKPRRSAREINSQYDDLKGRWFDEKDREREE